MSSRRSVINIRSAYASLLTIFSLAFLATPLLAQGTPDSVAQTPPQTPTQTQPQAQPKNQPQSDQPYYAKVWTPRARTGEIHIHGGVFQPIDGNATSATLGLRLGLDLGSHIQLGVSGDWAYGTKSLLEPVPGGLPGFEPEIELAKVNAQLIPAMLFLQVKLTDQFPIVPYAGIAGGYEWLILDAHDYRPTLGPADVSRTYADLAWQTYAGLGLRLSQGVRLDGELLYNSGRLARDVTDQFGDTYSETVNVDGVGVRVGLNVVY